MAYSKEQLQKAREYAAENPIVIAAEALTADYYADHVTLEKRYQIRDKNLKLASEIVRGLHDHNFTIAQRMHYYLTGESVALLP